MLEKIKIVSLTVFVLICVSITNSNAEIIFNFTNGIIDIFSFTETLNGKLKYDPYKAKITISFSTNTLEFFEDREFYILNSNTILPIIGGLVRTNFNYYLPIGVVDSIISLLKIECKFVNIDISLKNPNNSNNFGSSEEKPKDAETQLKLNPKVTYENAQSDFTPIRFVVIDAGHGGKDPGAVHNGFREKDINLIYAREIASKLARILSSKGINVVLTRNEDAYLTLEQRAKITSDLMKQTQGYGIFISIHQNASPIKTKKGPEIYYVSDKAVDDDTRAVLAFENSFIPKDEIKKVGELEKIISKIRSVALMEESRILSETISSSMINLKPIVKGAPFYVIKYIPVPSILVEVGYISNPEEVKTITSKDYISSFTDMISNGINKFIQEYNSTKGFTTPR
ncbi:MAG: N-acetylmuramoyl-L-alanine amidase [Brevinematales bacterium]|nr:N-acetylmuramoyl-L-alanine amidase [Brevinematales bacterium]